MDSIYLIRHTTPAVAKGMCYGQSDLDVTESFAAETAAIRGALSPAITSVFSSPLKRCSLLAQELFPGRPLRLMDALMEIDCGRWEMRPWDELPPEEIEPWMADLVQVRIPGGESYEDLRLRVSRAWETIGAEKGPGDIAVIAHGGVIRSILAGITGTSLIESFKAFSLHYGCVIRVYGAAGDWKYEVLLNEAPPEREQHKPKSFYR
ncbi:MAG TPA: alpha-ribazole phosphatase family protein [Puia sp.]|nr:alpha-ribazole phosphatase family protein [Puia sp.]